MAQKRMFDKRVVDTDKFSDLPHSTKALYFLAGMYADDRGFFQPRGLQRQWGFNDDDYKLLIAKGFFIIFESGVMVITDWKKNNWLDSRRITETEYVDELKLLKIINDKYVFNDNNFTQIDIAKPMLSEYSIEENRIEENSIYNKQQKNFKKPTIEELENFIKENNLKIDAEYFINYYESNGWYVGKTKMKDWKATARNWNKRNFDTKKENVPNWLNQDIKQEKVSLEEEIKLKEMMKEFK